MARSRPPLPQVRTFIAVVADGRLNRAATALGLSESAVSHHLRKLEGALGTQLLERGRTQALPTPAGERFYTRVRSALQLFDEAVDEAAGAPYGKVSLTLPRALATHWLVPRYPTLYQRQDDLELQLLPTVRVCDLEREQIDLGIRLGDGHWPGLEACSLVAERIGPLATPAVAKEWRARGWDALVRSHRLIANATHPGEWRAWCVATQRTMPDEVRCTTLESFDLVLQAGLAGSGLIMGRTPMVGDALTRGDLVAPFADWMTNNEASYYLVWPENSSPTRQVRVVMDWLLDCARGQYGE